MYVFIKTVVDNIEHKTLKAGMFYELIWTKWYVSMLVKSINKSLIPVFKYVCLFFFCVRTVDKERVLPEADAVRLYSTVQTINFECFSIQNHNIEKKNVTKTIATYNITVTTETINLCQIL